MNRQSNALLSPPRRIARSTLLLVLAVLLAACNAPALPFVGADSATTQTQIAGSAPDTPSVLVPASSLAQGTGDGVALEEQLIQLYRQANPATVYIATPFGSGSGFVYDSDGHIVTNHHVVEGASSFEVVFAGNERRAARLSGVDADADLAVLQVDDLPAGITPLPLAAPDDIQVGQFVVAIGSPFGEQGSMSLGIVSALGRSLPSQRGNGQGGYSLPQVIQTDAPINPGNSGGPLLNLDGAVVGVNSAIASTNGANNGVGFAIPVAALHRIVPSLIADGGYTYPYLGVSFDEEVSLDELSLYGLTQTQGAYILSVVPGGPAATAGLIGANANTGRGGDLVIAIDGQAVSNFRDLNSYLVFHTAAGQQIQLTVVRNGFTVPVALTLGARP